MKLCHESEQTIYCKCFSFSNTQTRSLLTSLLSFKTVIITQFFKQSRCRFNCICSSSYATKQKGDQLVTVFLQSAVTRGHAEKSDCDWLEAISTQFIFKHIFFIWQADQRKEAEEKQRCDVLGGKVELRVKSDSRQQDLRGEILQTDERLCSGSLSLMRHKHTEAPRGSRTETNERGRNKDERSGKTKWTLSLSLTGDRPTFKNIHHVEKGQGQRRLPAARATADSHLAGETRENQWASRWHGGVTWDTCVTTAWQVRAERGRSLVAKC